LFVCAEIATLVEGNADLEVGRGNFESQYALMVKQLARKDAELEAEEKERDDLEATLKKENADLEKEKAALEATLEKEKADLEAEILELKLEHKQDHKEIYDLPYTPRSCKRTWAVRSDTRSRGGKSKTEG
jgi:peptidoglycan hydrolase CwlO-like protein